MRAPTLVILAAAALLASCADFSGQRSGNEVLSSNNDPVILFNEEQERAIGQETAAAALKQYKRSPDEDLQGYVAGVGKRIGRVSDRPELDYQFTVLDSKEVNAFATPGGFVFITTALLKDMKDEAELGAVLGHEIGHVVRRHSLKRMQRQFVAQNGLAVLSDLLGGKSGALVAQLGPIAGNLLLLRNSREAELEADEQGLLNASRAGLDPAAMVGVQEMLLKNGGASQGPFAVMAATHPPSEDRILQAQKLLPKYQGPGALDRGVERYRSGVLTRLAAPL